MILAAYAKRCWKLASGRLSLQGKLPNRATPTRVGSTALKGN